MAPFVPREVQHTANPNTTPPDDVTINPQDNAALLEAREKQKNPPELPPISIDSVNYAQAKFDQMDGNGDGFVSPEELAGFAKANKSRLSDDEQRMLDDLQKHMDPLQKSSNDEFGIENDGFTRHDLMASKKDASASATVQSHNYDGSGGDLRAALEYAGKNFTKLDADKDGLISFSELNNYMENNQLTSAEERMLTSLKENSLAVMTMHQDGDEVINITGISVQDLAGAHRQINDLTFAVEHFDELDADGNGFVSAQEINGYERARDDLSRSQRKALDDLKAQVEQLEDYHNDEFGPENDGFTGNDLLDAMSALGSSNARGTKNFDDVVAERNITLVKNPDGSVTAIEPAADQPADAQKPVEIASARESDSGQTQAEEEPRYHTVKQNDSLWKICREELRQQSGGQEPSYRDIIRSVNEMAAANGMTPDQYIHPGDRLKMPARSVQTEPAPGSLARRHPAEERPQAEDSPSGTRDWEAFERLNQGRDSTQRTVKPQTAKQILSQNMYAIDADGNNRASRIEIENFINRYQGSLSEREVTLLDRYARNADKIQELSNDERGDENSGISFQDMDKLEQMQKVSKFMLNNFFYEDVNENPDRFLKKDEITNALLTRNLTPDQRTALNYLRDNYGKFQEGSNDETGDENSGITLNDLRYYANLV